MKKLSIFYFGLLLLILAKIVFPEQDYCFKYIAGCKPHIRVLKGINWPDNVFIVLDSGHCKTDCSDPGTDNKSYSSRPDCPGPIQSQTENIFGEVYEKDVTKIYVEGVRTFLRFYGYKNIYIIDHKLENLDRADDAFEYFQNEKTKYDNLIQQKGLQQCAAPFIPIFVSIHFNGDCDANMSGTLGIFRENNNNVCTKIHELLVPQIGVDLGYSNQQLEIFYKNGDIRQTCGVNPLLHTIVEVGYLRNLNDMSRMFYKPLLIPNLKTIGAIAQGIHVVAFSKPTRIFWMSSVTSSGCSGYSGDTPDDNNSSYSGADFDFSPNMDSKILLPLEFITEDSMKFLFSMKESPAIYFREMSSDILKRHPVLFVPTGALQGMEDDSTIKVMLDQYVKEGNTIVVLGQQYGSNIDNVVPVPEGESLHTYGWREDQSCAGNAGYFKQMHPALAAMTSQNVNINVDGYFGTYPSSATLLLRRVSNQQPCLISYPYGSGTVILTSMYSDWGEAHSQASASELRLVRDLVTYAKNPNLAIPMYNLTSNPHPDISLNVTVKNESESAASKVKLKVYTPDRKIVLHETEAFLALDRERKASCP